MAPHQSGKPTRNQLLGACVLILLVTVISFSSVLSSQFLNWKDPAFVVENSQIRSLNASSIVSLFTVSSLPLLHQYTPLTFLTYAIEYQLAGLNPAVFHGTNIALHALNALLIFWFVFRLSGSISFSLTVALLCAVHPLRVESVAWVSERATLLAGATFFGSLLSYVLFLQRSKDTRLLALAGALFLLSLCSSWMTIGLPLILLLLDLHLGRTLDRQALLEKIPFFALSFAFGILAFTAGLTASGPLFQSGSDAVSISQVDRLLLAGYSVFFYLFKGLIPESLSVLYSFSFTAMPWYVMIFPMLVLLSMAALVISRRQSPSMFFGGMFFLITLVPISQFVTPGGALLADRFTYIPLFGMLFFLVSGLLSVRDRLRKQFTLPSAATLVVAILWMGILTSASIARTKIWTDSIRLWTSATSQSSPPPLAFLQRGMAFEALRNNVEATADYTRAVILDSTLAVGWNNRGNIFARLGRYDAAVEDYSRAINNAPSFVDAYVNRGRALTSQKKFADARESYSQAILLEPSNALTFYYRGQLFLTMGKPDSALLDYDHALRINPEYTEAYVRRGDAYFQKQMYKEAIADYSEGINRGASHELLFTNRGSSYANLRDLDKAIADFDMALAINPNYTDALENRGIAFIGKKDYRIALAHFTMLEQMGHAQDPRIMKFLREQAAAQPKKK